MILEKMRSLCISSLHLVVAVFFWAMGGLPTPAAGCDIVCEKESEEMIAEIVDWVFHHRLVVVAGRLQVALGVVGEEPASSSFLRPHVSRDRESIGLPSCFRTY